MSIPSHSEQSVCALLDTIDGILLDETSRFTNLLLPQGFCLRAESVMTLRYINVPRRLRRRLLGFEHCLRQPGYCTC